MSLKKVQQVRSDRGFKIWDIVIYAVLAVLIIALFIAFVFTRDSSPITSIEITYGFGESTQTVCTYNFITDTLSVNNAEHISVSYENDDGIEIYFYGADSGEYNVIYVDKVNVSVSVTEANCPALDCVYTAAITKTSSLPIICSTHRMIITTGYVSGSVIE